MKIKKLSSVQVTEIDNEVAKKVKARVLIGKDDGATNYCMRLFELGKDGHTPLHSHAWEHEIFVHSGQAAAYQEGQWVPVKVGDSLFIPGHEEHQLKNTGDEPVKFICVIPSGVPEL